MSVFSNCVNEGRFTHPVKDEEVVALTFSNTEWSSQIHKDGCAHAKKANTVDDYYGSGRDDFWYVAPCARKGSNTEKYVKCNVDTNFFKII